MTDVKRLLAEATPLPWRVHCHAWEDGETYSVGGPPLSRMPAPVVVGEADADLIVHAVNHLPEAIEALESLLICFDGFEDADLHALGMKRTSVCVGQARAALARLRDDAA